MLHNLKTRVRRSVVLWRMKARGRRRAGTDEVVVGRTGTQLWRRVLLLVPGQRELVHQVALFLEKMKRLNPALSADIAVPEAMAGPYRTDPLYDDIIALADRNFTWLGFPAPELVRRIREKRYDLIIDCHQPLNIFMACLAAMSEQSFRIGIKSDQSAYFYNVELVPQEGGYLDMVYKTAMIL